MIVVRPDGHRVVLTDHAIARYRSRVDRRADAGDVARAVREAELRRDCPSGVATTVAANQLLASSAWLITSEWAAPLRTPDQARDNNAGDFDFMAVTVLRRQRRSKAEIRALREQAREDREWAA